MFLLAWKLNETKSPKAADAACRCQMAPMDCAASSITRRLVLAGDGVEPVAVHRQAGEVDRDDGAGLGRDGGLDAVEVDVARDRVDVDEHRPRADCEDRRWRWRPRTAAW